MGSAIAFFLKTLSLWLVLLAFIISGFVYKKNKYGYAYNLLIYLLLFAVGFQALWAFIFHIFFPSISADSIGWSHSPFQTEVGIANLAISVVGFICYY